MPAEVQVQLRLPVEEPLRGRAQEEEAEHLNRWVSVPLAERLQQVELEQGEVAARFPYATAYLLSFKNATFGNL